MKQLEAWSSRSTVISEKTGDHCRNRPEHAQGRNTFCKFLFDSRVSPCFQQVLYGSICVDLTKLPSQSDSICLQSKADAEQKGENPQESAFAKDVHVWNTPPLLTFTCIDSVSSRTSNRVLGCFRLLLCRLSKLESALPEDLMGRLLA